MTINSKLSGVAFEGNWDIQKAEQFVITHLEEYGSPVNWGFDEKLDSLPMEHLIHSIWPINNKDENTFIIVAYSRPKEYTCHACSPCLSLFEFFPNEKGWICRNKFIDIYEQSYSSWGEPPHEIALFPMGHRKFGVITYSQDVHQGYVSDILYNYIFSTEKNLKFEHPEIQVIDTLSIEWSAFMNAYKNYILEPGYPDELNGIDGIYLFNGRCYIHESDFN